MIAPDAFCFYKIFPPEPRKLVRFDRHYLLYSAAGSIDLEVDGRVWTLPPLRAAWIEAGVEIAVCNAQPITCCSLLYAPEFIAAPETPCKVFDITPLAREMILECRRWGPEGGALDTHARQFFTTLALVTRELAMNSCNSWVPVGQSAAVRSAIAQSREQLGAQPEFAQIASAVHCTPRTLARRFQAECGMSWQQVLRRLRMIRAAELLAEPQMQITQVAFAVGYASQSAFGAAFRDFAQQSPRDYRAGILRGLNLAVDATQS